MGKSQVLSMAISTQLLRPFPLQRWVNRELLPSSAISLVLRKDPLNVPWKYASWIVISSKIFFFFNVECWMASSETGIMPRAPHFSSPHTTTKDRLSPMTSARNFDCMASYLWMSRRWTSRSRGPMNSIPATRMIWPRILLWQAWRCKTKCCITR